MTNLSIKINLGQKEREEEDTEEEELDEDTPIVHQKKKTKKNWLMSEGGMVKSH